MNSLLERVSNFIQNSGATAVFLDAALKSFVVLVKAADAHGSVLVGHSEVLPRPPLVAGYPRLQFKNARWRGSE